MTNGLYNSMCELQAINYAYSKNSIQMFILNGITSDYFTTYKDHYNYIIRYHEKYNQLPSKEIFQSKFSDNFEWIVVSDSEESIIDRLREAKLFRDLINDYNEFFINSTNEINENFRNIYIPEKTDSNSDV